LTRKLSAVLCVFRAPLQQRFCDVPCKYWDRGQRPGFASAPPTRSTITPTLPVCCSGVEVQHRKHAAIVLHYVACRPIRSLFMSVTARYSSGSPARYRSGFSVLLRTSAGVIVQLKSGYTARHGSDLFTCAKGGTFRGHTQHSARSVITRRLPTV
jgi:hypothetical protein